MQTVKLEKPTIGKGWFLTIGDDYVKHKWAVSSLELLTLQKLIKDNLEVIKKETEK